MIETGQISLSDCVYFPNCLVSRIWVKVFKIRPSKICGRQPLKTLKRYGQPK